jgi:phage gpG-like protein
MIEFIQDIPKTTEWLRAKPEKLRAGMRSAMQRIGIMVLATVQRKLSGEVLNIRSGKLIRSAHTFVEEDGNSISAVVQAGALAPYGAVHETGGTFTIPLHMSTSRKGKRFPVRAHQATFPQRAFMAPALEENNAAINAEIARATAEGLN